MTVTCIGALFALSNAAAAQQRLQPEVQIDTSVLQQLAPAATDSQYSRPVLSRPVSRPAQPVLTAPAARRAAPAASGNAAILSAPAGTAQPYAMRRTGNTPDITPTAYENFPVKSTVRSGSTNPAAGRSQPIGTSVPTTMVAPTAAASAQPQLRPVPPRPPVTADLTARPAASPAKAAAVPVPPRKPEKRGATAAPAAADDDIPDVTMAYNSLPPTTVPAPSPPARRSKAIDAGILRNAPKVMPAVPTRPVGVEQLAAVPGIAVAATNDPLLLQLKDFNRDLFVRQVEDLTKRAAAPVPPRKPQRGMPPPLDKTNLAALTARAARAAAEADRNAGSPGETALRLAALEPAAGGHAVAQEPPAREERKPRPPSDAADGDAQRGRNAHITVPFDPGTDKAGPTITSRLDDEVLPLLRRNPTWRIQIQAFSSPDEQARSGARRTALSRALSVREYLMNQGIEAPRMDIRALGMETDRNPRDRVDLLLFDPAENT